MTGPAPRPDRADERLLRLLSAEGAAGEAGRAASRLWQQLHAADVTTTRVSLDALLRQSLESLRDAVESDAASILVANERGDELIARVSVGLLQELYLGLRIPAGAGMAGRVLANRAPLLVDDLSRTELASDALPSSGIRSVVAVPILAEGRVLGVLHAASREPAHFGEREAATLEAVASRLGAAMERVGLFEAERVARARAESLARTLGRLQTITAALAATSTVDRVAEILAEQLSEHFAGGLADCALWLREGSEQRLVRVSGMSGTGPAFAVAIDSAEPEAVAARHTEEVWAVAGGHWVVALPLVAGESLVGVLSLRLAGELDGQDADRRLLAAVAPQAAQALDRVRLQRSQSFLLETTHMLAEAPSYEVMLERLASLVVPALADVCFIDVVDQAGVVRREIGHHADPLLQPLTDQLRFRYGPDAESAYPGVQSMRRRAAVWGPELTDDVVRTMCRDEEHVRIIRRLRFASYLAIPLVWQEQVLGAMTLISAGSDRRFGPADVSFAEELARLVASVVDKARRHEQEHHRSRMLQASLLPSVLPLIPGLEASVRYLPGTTDFEVGGDFYDIIGLPDGVVRLVIGDVAGHDASAAATMGQLRSVIRGFASQADDPAVLIEALRESWTLLDFERMATVLFVDLTPGTGMLRLASAGHLPPVMTGGGSATLVAVQPTPPLGAPAGPSVAPWEGRLGDGGVLLMYTDGLVEGRRRNLNEGIAELCRVAGDGPADPEALCERVVQALVADHRDDDVALLAVSRTP